MADPKLILVVGCPGSGKTYHLNDMKANGLIDLALEDYIDKVEYWDRRIPKVRQHLLGGKRVGICGRFLRLQSRRDDLRNLLRRETRQIEYVFFEPDFRACLANIIKDRLRSKGVAYDRACLVVGIAEGALYEIPAGVERHPVYQQSVTLEEVDEFFRMEPRFGADGQRRIKSLLNL